MVTHRVVSNWRGWSLAVVVLMVAVLDIATPNIPLYTFVLVPVVASALLGRPVLTLSLAALGALSSLGVYLVVSYQASSLVSHLILVLACGVVSAALAEGVRRADQARVGAVRDLALSEHRYRTLADSVADLVVQQDSHGRLTYVSPSAKELLGYEPSELVGTWLPDLFHPDDTDPSLLRVRRKDGKFRWFSATTRTLLDADGHVQGDVSSWRDVDEQVFAQAEIARLASTDTLTGIANRRVAIEHLEKVSASTRDPGSLVAVLFIDLDNFKGVNDSLGHAAGDILLSTIAQRLARGVRSSDLVARTGGDEFLVVLEGVHSLREAQGVAQNLLDSVSQVVPTPAGPINATVSIGVTVLRPGQSADEAIAHADRAMYEAKAAGRGRVVSFS